MAFIYRRVGQVWNPEAEVVVAKSGFAGLPLRPIALGDGVLVVADFSMCQLAVGGSTSAAPAQEAPQSQSRVVSCFGTQGHTFVFRRGPQGWVSEGTLPLMLDLCEGNQVAVDGDIIANIGHSYATPQFTLPVVIYRHNAGMWAYETHVDPSIAATVNAAVFPMDLGIADGRIAAGYHSTDNGAADTGAAFLIEQVNGVWTETARFAVESPAADDDLGFGVAIGGNEVFLGAPYREVDGVVDTGAVYIYDVRDCDADGFPDDCPDGCADPQACEDCNNNGTRDGCDVDCDSNGTPDDCECIPVTMPAALDVPCCNNRFIEVALPESCQRSAARVRMVSLHHPTPPGPTPAPDFSAFESGPNCIEGSSGCVRWAGAPDVYVDSAAWGSVFTGSMLACQPT